MNDLAKKAKPLGGRAYGSIPHLPASRRGPADQGVTEGEARIATEKARDAHDFVVVQSKLDGTCVAVARQGGRLLAVTRAGYLATDSPYPMHHRFAAWVDRPEQQERFARVLSSDGERLCGEWLVEAHGTRYDLPHEPFVAFDLIGSLLGRLPFAEFVDRVGGDRGVFTVPMTLHAGGPLSVALAVAKLDEPAGRGWHGEVDPAEGCVWRVERRGVVNFLCKFVRQSKVDGKYLPSSTGGPPVRNTWPGSPDGLFPWERA